MGTIALPLLDLDDLSSNTNSLLARLDFIQDYMVERAFDGIVDRSDGLLRRLSDPELQHLSATQFVELAVRLESVVALRKRLAAKVRALKLAPNKACLDILEEQCERFDSLAETFRLAADPGMRTRISALLKASDHDTADGAQQTNWRDFVGSMRD